MSSRARRLVDIQAQQVEVGRIRLGTTQPKQARSGKTYNEPVKLSRFRLTSRSEQLIRAAADLYGGEVQPWTPQNGGAQQWEVIVEAASMAVIVPPDSLSQYYEQWSGGKCTRRCDGATELLTMQQCPCGPTPEAKKAAGCKPTTRLGVMLADLPGIGVWRLETHGYYAAAELPAAADLLSAAGGNIPARLELEERAAQVPDPRNASKTVTARYMVPVIHVELAPAQLVAVRGQVRPALEPQQPRPALQTAERPALGAAPEPEQPDEPSPEVSAQQWKVHSWFEDRIAVAEGDTLTAIADRIRTDQRILPQWRDSLLDIVARRVDSIAAAAAANAADTSDDPWAETGAAPQWPPPAPPLPVEQPAGEEWEEEGVVYERPVEEVQLPADPPQAPGPAPSLPGPDRAQEWQALNLLAGQKGWTASRLRDRFKQTWSKDLAQATGEELARFREWLAAQP